MGFERIPAGEGEAENCELLQAQPYQLFLQVVHRGYVARDEFGQLALQVVRMRSGSQRMCHTARSAEPLTKRQTSMAELASRSTRS